MESVGGRKRKRGRRQVLQKLAGRGVGGCGFRGAAARGVEGRDERV